MVHEHFDSTLRKHLTQIRRRAYLGLTVYLLLMWIVVTNLFPDVYYAFGIPQTLGFVSAAAASLALVIVLGLTPILHFKEATLTETEKAPDEILGDPFRSLKIGEFAKSRGLEVERGRNRITIQGYPSRIHEILDAEVKAEHRIVSRRENKVAIESLVNNKIILRSRVIVREEEHKTRAAVETISDTRYSPDFVIFYQYILPKVISWQVEDEDAKPLDEHFWIQLSRPSFGISFVEE